MQKFKIAKLISLLSKRFIIAHNTIAENVIVRTQQVAGVIRCRLVYVAPGDTQQSFILGRLCPEVQFLTQPFT